MDAQRLQIHCLAEPDAVDGLLDVGLGYLAGAVDAMLMEGGAFCAPDDLSLAGVQVSVVEYIAANDLVGTAAAVAVERALAAAYPCALSTTRRFSSNP